MSKEITDYSNTIIYKIHCKDSSISDIYVGHTTNFFQRKYSHKIACRNLKNNLKIYEIIRNNGGWENWDMVEIAKYCCKNAKEARIKEQYHFEESQASLNSIPPYVDKTKYFCSICNLQYYGPSQYNKHVLSNKHIKKMDLNLNTDNTIMNNTGDAKKEFKFTCDLCDFKCYKQSNYLRHIETTKHVQAVNDNNMKMDYNEKIKISFN